MRKDQIDSAGVNVERFAQVAHRHGGAFDVPAGAPWPEGRFPGRLVLLLRLPEHKIASVGLIVLIHIDARAAANSAEIVMRELAVIGEIRDAEIGGAVARIRAAFCGKLFDGFHHHADVLGRRRDMLWLFQANRGGIFKERLGEDGGILFDRFILLLRR